MFKTFMGRMWFLVTPLTHMLIYYFFLVIVLGARNRMGVNPFVFIMTGLTHYLFFTRAVNTSSGAILNNAKLLMQVKLEPLIFTAVTFNQALIDFIIWFGVYGVFYVILGPHVSWATAFYPLVLITLLVMAWSMSVLVSCLAVFIRDVQYFIPLAFRMLLYLSPVIYPVSFVEKKYHAFYFLNPLAGLFAGLQWTLLGGPFPPVPSLVICGVFVVLLVIAAHVVYTLGKHRFTKIF